MTRQFTTILQMNDHIALLSGCAREVYLDYRWNMQDEAMSAQSSLHSEYFNLGQLILTGRGDKSERD